MSWDRETVPNPGSAKARKEGCTCAVIDNHYGQGLPGYRDDELPVFWVDDDCPLHGGRTPTTKGELT